MQILILSNPLIAYDNSLNANLNEWSPDSSIASMNTMIILLTNSPKSFS